MGIDLRNGYRDLLGHSRHDVRIDAYGKLDGKGKLIGDPVNIAIACHTCQTILLDFNVGEDADDQEHAEPTLSSGQLELIRNVESALNCLGLYVEGANPYPDRDHAKWDAEHQRDRLRNAFPEAFV